MGGVMSILSPRGIFLSKPEKINHDDDVFENQSVYDQTNENDQDYYDDDPIALSSTNDKSKNNLILSLPVNNNVDSLSSSSDED